ncbi:MAG: hypothetical protein J6L69_01600 [Lachnospiraceae bacterium]|nr:hypothetical protein [Lachnospiraceae bacterium]
MNKYSNNIDMIINNKELNILKSIFPLLPANAKKGLAVYIAINELTTALSILKLIGNNNNFNTPSTGELDFSKIFEVSKAYLSKEEVENIENYINIFNMMKMFNEMSSTFSDESDSTGFNPDILKSMLSPEQAAIFETFSNNNQ